MLDWGVTPEEINAKWTEELLQLMFESRTKRILRTIGEKPVESRNVVHRKTNDEFFKRHHIRVKEVGRGEK